MMPSDAWPRRGTRSGTPIPHRTVGACIGARRRIVIQSSYARLSRQIFMNNEVWRMPNAIQQGSRRMRASSMRGLARESKRTSQGLSLRSYGYIGHAYVCGGTNDTDCGGPAVRNRKPLEDNDIVTPANLPPS